MTKAQLEAKVVELELRIVALERRQVHYQPIASATILPQPIDVDYTIVPRRIQPTA